MFRLQPWLTIASLTCFLVFTASARGQRLLTGTPLPGTVADGIGHFVVITVDRAAQFGTRFWIDGELGAIYDTLNVTGSLDAAVPLILGRRGPAAGGDAPFSGTLDELQLFDRVLTDPEIRQLFVRCARPFVDDFGTGDASRWALSVGDRQGDG